ncbi:SRPBCC family protein [Rhodovibrio salinarum]|uniref:SRPBCC family protein n=1 Tax=Rhodovibrio salinarum TaxID=1087 RepID=A0A934UYP4_9PROT|nr:SRPBCC family protein [Rhodovibrio salinarum]MBK1696267.1 SRPBCC family protein [Rhodovibrio salinarum]
MIGHTKIAKERSLQMAKVSEAARLYISAERVWETIGRFESIDSWHPSVLGIEMSGSEHQPERRLELGDPEKLVDRLESHDDAAMSYRYSYRGGPLPLSEMTAELRVKPDDAASCTIEWSADLSPDGDTEQDQAVAELQNFFRRGLEHLRFTLAG